MGIKITLTCISFAQSVSSLTYQNKNYKISSEISESYLEIYKYTDDTGKVVVTTNLNNIPMKYRNAASTFKVRRIFNSNLNQFKSFLQSFNKNGNIASNECNIYDVNKYLKPSEVDYKGDINNTQIPLVQFEQPVPEIVNIATEPEWILAADWLNDLVEAMNIVEQIIFVGKNVSIKDQRITFWRNLILKRIDQASKKSALDWKRGYEWVTKAKEVTNRSYYLIGVLSKLVEKPSKDIFTEFINVAIPIINAVNYLKGSLPQPIYIELERHEDILDKKNGF